MFSHTANQRPIIARYRIIRNLEQSIWL